MGDIAVLALAHNGDLLVGDRVVPRVRRYRSDGSMLAEFGTYGDGPFEFRRIGGLVEGPFGEVIVADPARSRITGLGPDLRPDTSFRIRPSPAGSILRVGEGYLVKTLAGRRTTGIEVKNDEWERVWSTLVPAPSIAERPYWSSYASTLVAASTDVIASAYSFSYPIRLYSVDGTALGTIEVPPASFLPARILKPGALTGPGATDSLTEWLGSLTEIGHLGIMADSVLVVVHGTLQRSMESSQGRLERQHHAADFYDVMTMTKLAEDVPLPSNVRILATGPKRLYAVSTLPSEVVTISVIEVTR